MNFLRSKRALWSLGRAYPALLSAFIFSTFALAESGPKVISISGAGATFPYPLYSKWFSVFHDLNPSTEISYQSIGSGGGIRQLMGHTVDFGASDAPMKDDQMAKADPKIIHVPTVLGAVAITYNLPLEQSADSVKLNPGIIEEILLGTILYWDDVKIKKLNPNLQIPHIPLLVVYRSDGSGTTAVFTDYLCKVSAAFKEKVGQGTAVKWPVGIGGKGNEGVTGFVKHHVGAFGYVELLYAEKNHLPRAQLQNSGGRYIQPDAKSISAAAQSFVAQMPNDFRISITNAPGIGAYPISAFTYLLFPVRMAQEKGMRLKSFTNWALTDGQKLATEMFYAPLPLEVAKKALASLKAIELL